jgi:hypothetical protein
VKTEYWLFSGGVLWLFPVGTIYGILTQWNEWVGVVAIYLTGGLALLLGSYLWLTSRRIDPRPEDDAFGDIADGAGEQGIFPPHSWWPLAVGLCIAVTFVGLAVGWWLSIIGGGLALISLVGWVFEFYRGAHAH